ncbi:MAG TPA: hypothetical protein DIT18_08095 [Pseudomonas sp.]|nr:hypothetical protein [Pseudomonas sp.]
MANFTEYFNQTSLHELAVDESFKTPGGMILKLVSFPDAPGAKPSGVRAAPTANNAKNRELVIGDLSGVTIEFGKLAKALSFEYRFTFDFTEQDQVDQFGVAGGWSNATLSEEWSETFASVTFRRGDTLKTYSLPGVTDFTVFNKHTAPFDELLIMTSRVGKLHLDSVKWNDA